MLCDSGWVMKSHAASTLLTETLMHGTLSFPVWLLPLLPCLGHKEAKPEGDTTCRPTDPVSIPSLCVISAGAPDVWVNESLVDSNPQPTVNSSLLLFPAEFPDIMNRDKPSLLFLF